MTQYWFKPKHHGYGAAPSNWRGWVATLGFLLVIVAFTYALVASQQGAGSPPSDWIIAIWLLGLCVLVGGFVWLARTKTDGEWGWRWGK